MNTIYPPDFDFSRVAPKACIDFITICTTQRRAARFSAGCSAKWIPKPDEDGRMFWLLTLQDPDACDVRNLYMYFPQATVMEIEISLDFWPKFMTTADERVELMNQTMRAIAGRLRPDEAYPYGFGFRACVLGKGARPAPFHDRQPPAGAQLLWGTRKCWAQVKAYPKRTDNNSDLAADQWRARVEVALRRGYLIELGVERPGDLLRLEWRKVLSPFFRFIALPMPRRGKLAGPGAATMPAALRAWRRGGAGAFVAKAPPTHARNINLDSITYRTRRQVAQEDVRLVRHRRANELVGNALRQLQRRVRTARFSGGITSPARGGSQR